MDKDKQFWQEEGFWHRLIGALTPTAKIWFFAILFLMVFGGFYIGFWVSCNAMDHPIDVPYVSSDSYYESKEAAEAAARDIFGDDNILTVLMLGCDSRAENDVGRSDTIMVAFLNTINNSVGLLSIPRDTYVEIGGEMTKINHAYAYGGEALLQKTVENFLNVEIDRYVVVDFQGFIDIIDALGGVEYYVETDMYRPSENIDLKEGLQVLDGENALAYCRWRGDPTADIGRVGRQQKFLEAVADDLFDLGTLFKLPSMMSTINDNVDTNFTVSELTSMIELFKDTVSLQFRAETVPGEGAYINHVSYWQAYENQLATIVDEMMTITEESAPVDPTTSENGTNGENGTAES